MLQDRPDRHQTFTIADFFSVFWKWKKFLLTGMMVAVLISIPFCFLFGYSTSQLCVSWHQKVDEYNMWNLPLHDKAAFIRFLARTDVADKDVLNFADKLHNPMKRFEALPVSDAKDPSQIIGLHITLTAPNHAVSDGLARAYALFLIDYYKYKSLSNYIKKNYHQLNLKLIEHENIISAAKQLIDSETVQLARLVDLSAGLKPDDAEQSFLAQVVTPDNNWTRYLPLEKQITAQKVMLAQLANSLSDQTKEYALIKIRKNIFTEFYNVLSSPDSRFELWDRVLQTHTAFFEKDRSDAMVFVRNEIDMALLNINKGLHQGPDIFTESYTEDHHLDVRLKVFLITLSSLFILIVLLVFFLEGVNGGSKPNPTQPQA